MNQKVNLLTDIGKMREENQDALSYHKFDDETWFITVSDGMGGYAGGSLASKTVVENLIEEVKEINVDQFRENPTLFLRKSINAANADVNYKAQHQLEFKDMGATCVCCFIDSGKVTCAHIGDSRAYLLRNGEIKQITEDHTVVEDLIRAGYVSPEDAAYHPSSGILTKCLGQMEIPDPEFTPQFSLEEGDRILLCSDGLSGMLDDDEIAEIIFNETDEKAPEALIDMANEAGGFDNITVLIFSYGDLSEKIKNVPIKVGTPFYATTESSTREDPTVPFKLRSKKSGQLKNTVAMNTVERESVSSKILKSKVTPVLIGVMILLFGLIIWYFGGLGL